MTNMIQCIRCTKSPCMDICKLLWILLEVVESLGNLGVIMRVDSRRGFSLEIRRVQKMNSLERHNHERVIGFSQMKIRNLLLNTIPYRCQRCHCAKHLNIIEANQMYLQLILLSGSNPLSVVMVIVSCKEA